MRKWRYGVEGFHAAYGKTEQEAEPIFRRYLEAGGNLGDTADFYTAGESERILGRLIPRQDPVHPMWTIDDSYG